MPVRFQALESTQKMYVNSHIPIPILLPFLILILSPIQDSLHSNTDPIPHSNIVPIPILIPFLILILSPFQDSPHSNTDPIPHSNIVPIPIQPQFQSPARFFLGVLLRRIPSPFPSATPPCLLSHSVSSIPIGY